MVFICCYLVGNDLWAVSYSVSGLVHSYPSILALFSIHATQAGVPLMLFLLRPPIRLGSPEI